MRMEVEAVSAAFFLVRERLFYSLCICYWFAEHTSKD
jgi:hypothetical protein